MKILGLPGEAAVPLVLGNFINLYAGIGAMASLSLSAKQATILAIMLSFSHSLLLESVVVKKNGSKLSIDSNYKDYIGSIIWYYIQFNIVGGYYGFYGLFKREYNG